MIPKNEVLYFIRDIIEDTRDKLSAAKKTGQQRSLSDVLEIARLYRDIELYEGVLDGLKRLASIYDDKGNYL